MSFQPGETCSTSGIYKNTTTKNEVTVVKGEPFPPTAGPSQTYVLVRETK